MVIGGFFSADALLRNAFPTQNPLIGIPGALAIYALGWGMLLGAILLLLGAVLWLITTPNKIARLRELFGLIGRLLRDRRTHVAIALIAAIGLVVALTPEPRNGLFIELHENGEKKSAQVYVSGHKISKTTYVDGQASFVTKWYRDSQIKKSEEGYKNGQLEGPTTKWNGEGQIVFQGNYHSGKFTGEVIHWLGNGQAFVEEKFVDGTRTEYAETLGQEHANGQLNGEQRWINGKRHTTFWYENGQKERFSTVDDEVEDGRRTEWYENGQKKLEFRQVFGVTEGRVTYWYDNGQKKAEVNVLHDERNGVHTQWFEDGRVKSEIKYIAGVREDRAAEPGPPPPRNPEVTGSGLDVTYGMHRGSIRFWNTAIQSVSDGTFTGNTAVVTPGASVRMTGNWEFGPVTDPGNCPGCNVQIYIAWVAPATERGAWPPSEYLWQGTAQSVIANNEPSGTFDWTSQAPTSPGFYYVGRGQTLDYSFKLKTQGRLGVTTAGPAIAKAASFVIEVREEAANEDR